MRKRVAQLESVEYTKEVIETFKSSEEYNDALIAESFAFLQLGSAHMVRQLHHFFKDKGPLIEACELFFASKEVR